jgi:hypothetical protein
MLTSPIMIKEISTATPLTMTPPIPIMKFYELPPSKTALQLKIPKVLTVDLNMVSKSSSPRIDYLRPRRSDDVSESA